MNGPPKTHSDLTISDYYLFLNRKTIAGVLEIMFNRVISAEMVYRFYDIEPTPLKGSDHQTETALEKVYEQK